MKKNLLVFLFVFLIAPFFFTNSTYAAESATLAAALPNQNVPLNTNPDVPYNMQTYTQSTIIELLNSFTCILGGQNFLNPTQQCLGFDPETKKIGYVKEDSGGVVGAMGSLIGSTYNIPVSSGQYAQYVAQNFGITKTSYAQEEGRSLTGTGIGFAGLSPLLPIWTVLRNLAYMFFVLVFVLLGLGIMFRVNIDARTVMTIQNQIPKIIISLVLITFSYAIAGFFIDMMYLVTYLIINIFAQNDLATVTNISGNPLTAVGYLSGGFHGIAEPPASSVGNIVSSLFDGGIGKTLSTIVGVMIGSMLGSGTPAGGIVGGILGGLAGFIGGNSLIKLIAFVIVYLIIVIAVLNALFRVWFMLIKAYVFIILDVIFAPFWIMMGLFPTNIGGIGPWIRSLIANLAAFPAVLLLFMVGKTVQENLNPSAGGNFIPPLVGDLGADSVAGVGSIIGLGIILIMPEAVNMTKNALKAPDLKLSAAAGRAIGVGQSVVSKPIKGVQHELFGKDTFGNPKAGSAWLGRYGGRIMQGLSGGGISQKDGEGKKTNNKWVAPLKWRTAQDGKVVRKWNGRLNDLGKERKAEAEAKAAAEEEAKKKALGLSTNTTTTGATSGSEEQEGNQESNNTNAVTAEAVRKGVVEGFRDIQQGTGGGMKSSILSGAGTLLNLHPDQDTQLKAQAQQIASASFANNPNLSEEEKTKAIEKEYNTLLTGRRNKIAQKAREAANTARGGSGATNDEVQKEFENLYTQNQDFS